MNEACSDYLMNKNHNLTFIVSLSTHTVAVTIFRDQRHKGAVKYCIAPPKPAKTVFSRFRYRKSSDAIIAARKHANAVLESMANAPESSDVYQETKTSNLVLPGDPDLLDSAPAPNTNLDSLPFLLSREHRIMKCNHCKKDLDPQNVSLTAIPGLGKLSFCPGNVCVTQFCWTRWQKKNS